MKIKVELLIEVDDMDADEFTAFGQYNMSGLILHSNEIGDEVGVTIDSRWSIARNDSDTLDDIPTWDDMAYSPKD